MNVFCRGLGLTLRTILLHFLVLRNIFPAGSYIVVFLKWVLQLSLPRRGPKKGCVLQMVFCWWVYSRGWGEGTLSHKDPPKVDELVKISKQVMLAFSVSQRFDIAPPSIRLCFSQ